MSKIIIPSRTDIKTWGSIISRIKGCWGSGHKYTDSDLKKIGPSGYLWSMQPIEPWVAREVWEHNGMITEDPQSLYHSLKDEMEILACLHSHKISRGIFGRKWVTDHFYICGDFQASFGFTVASSIPEVFDLYDIWIEDYFAHDNKIPWHDNFCAAL